MSNIEFELCKYRSDIFQKDNEVLRSIEWRTALEVFVGYAAIGAGVFQVEPTCPSPKLLCVLMATATIWLFLWSLYLSLRLQERLHFTRNMRNEYISRLHKISGIPEITVEAGIAKLKHKYWYAFAAQLALSAGAALTVLGLILFNTKW